ncbi:hypothetical protein [Paludisphaera rhizosphaerae]|uniref:hypothetical protein n=1 Tax=Paludisphaera rhizosphaerae TaxID=2711216 RepID=UPI0013EAF97B|nr:hypothetical protein [Paludisphaera rhizosphaerae]
MTNVERGRLLAALRRLSRAAMPMEAALAKLSDVNPGRDAEREYGAAKDTFVLVWNRVHDNVPGGRLDEQVAVGADSLLATAAFLAEAVCSAACQKELGHFRTLVDKLRKTISLIVSTIGEISAIPPLPRDRDSLQAIIDETGRYADAAKRYRAVRMTILQLSRMPGAQEEIGEAYKYLDSIRGDRPRSEVYPEIAGLYPSADVLVSAYGELDEVEPLVKQAVSTLDASREYLYDDDLPQSPHERKAALEAGDDVFMKVISATDKLNQDARKALERIVHHDPHEPFDPAVPAAKPLPVDREILRRMLDELTAYLSRIRPVQEAYSLRKKLLASPEVQHALDLMAYGLRSIVKGDVPLVSFERIEANCPELSRIKGLSEIVDGYFKDHQARIPLILSADYLEIPRTPSQLRGMLTEMGPSGDLLTSMVTPVVALHRRIMDELAKPEPVVKAPLASVDYAAVVLAMQRQGSPQVAKLVEFMADKSKASFEEVAMEVHGDSKATSEAIQANIRRAKRLLARIESRIVLGHRGGWVFRELHD